MQTNRLITRQMVNELFVKSDLETRKLLEKSTLEKYFELIRKFLKGGQDERY